MVERAINVSTIQIEETQAMSKTDVRKVTPSNRLTAVTPVTAGFLLSPSEQVNAREYLRYAVESLRDVIKQEETYGNRAPILSTLREYARGAARLLERLG